MYSILIVDDEPMTREYMRTHIPLISKEWFVQFEAANGFDALNILKQNTVDLVITDIRMPRMDGLQLCQAIREFDSKQFIVILSGYDEFSYSREAIKYGVNEYLLKPIESASLSQTLEIIKSKLITKKQEQETYITLDSIANEYNRNIMNSYLQALVSSNKTQQRALSLLMEKHALSTVKTNGALMVFSLDTECLIDLKLPYDDFEVINLILFQVINEYALEYANAYTFLDPEQNAVVYLEDSEEIFFEHINNFMTTNTGFSVTAGCSRQITSQNDFTPAYRYANHALDYKLLHSQSGLYYYDPRYQEELKPFMHAINDIATEFKIDISETLKASVINYLSIQNKTEKKALAILAIKLLTALNDAENTHTAHAFNLLIEELTNEKNFTTASAAAHILNAINILKGSSSAKVTENSVHLHYIRCKAFIDEHFCEPISLSQIADYVGVSPNYLSNIFRECEGQSYIKYITKCRMEYALRQLKQDPNKKIATVSKSCGYTNIKHFYYVFKQYFKMTPGEYQKLNC